MWNLLILYKKLDTLTLNSF